MGMDLVGKKGSDHHFNWSGWRWMGQLLDGLGADTSEMAGSNDGDRVKAKTCKAWAKAIREAVVAKRVWLRHVRDKNYEGGSVDWPLVSKTRPKVAEGEDVTSLEDDKWSKEWVLDFAEFLENCGGFRQY